MAELHELAPAAFADAAPARGARRPRYLLSRLILLVLAIVLPLVALQVLALRRDRQAAEAAVYASLVGRAEDAAARVSNLFGRAEQLLGFLASREELRQLNVARCSELLAGAGDIADEYANIILVDAHGGLVCSSAPGAPASFADTPWFRQGIGAPSYRLNDPQWGRISHRQVSLLTLPVIGHGGGTVGLVAVAIDLRALAEMLPRGGLPPEATLSVVKGQSLFYTRSPDPAGWIGRPLADTVRSRQRDAHSGMLTVEGSDGVERALATVELPRYGLHVAAGVPSKLLYAGVDADVAKSVWQVGLVVCVGLLAAWFGSRRLAAPLERIADTARRLASGQGGVRADESLPGEFGEVAAEFNRLLERQAEGTARLRQSERRAMRVSSFYEALSSTNQAIVRLPAPQELFEEVCAICVRTRLADMAWIGLPADGRMRPVAWGGRARAYTAGLVIELGAGAREGPTVKALRSGRGVTVNRFQHDASTGPWHRRAAEFGIKASAAFPFARDGVVVGTLNLYVGEEDYFDDELVALLEAMMRDIAFALEAHQRRAERAAAEEARAALVEAEAAHRARSAFLSRVSHELRTPLNAILGFTQLLQREAGDGLAAPARRQLDNVYLAGTQLQALIDDVLDMSRVEAGQMALQRQDVELQPLLEGVLELGAPLAARHGVSLRGDYGAALRLRTDPVRLRQVLLNLVSNAIKYNRPGGTVRLTLETAPGEALLRVRDDGIGMSPAQMAGLFQPFNRLGRESSAIEGTGIGLHLARQLVELLGGRLEIASEEGAGTEATLRLPLAPPEAPPAPRAAPAPLPAAADGPAPRGRVLYVEDNPVNALLVEQLLATWPQVELRIAPTGAEGLAAAAQWRPDLVLLDMQLPDMTGLELLAALQADAATRSLRVVALSANALPEDVAAARRAGVEAYWTKPIDFAQVLQGVAERLRAAEAQREPVLEAS